MNEKYIERNRKTESFEAEHRDFLEKLKYIPIEQKEERWKFFNGYDRREDFIVELMEVYRPGTYNKIKKCLEKAEGNRLKEDSNIAYWGNKEFDTTVFMEAIKYAIENYTGKNKNGEEYGFVACVGIQYKQKAGITAAENTLRQKGISDSEIPGKDFLKILKLLKAAERVLIRNSEKISKEEALEQAIKEVSYKCTKKEKEMVRALFFSDNGSVVVSMDNPLKTNGGETGNTFGEQLRDERDDYELVIEKETGSYFFEVFFQEIENRWEIIVSAKGLRELEPTKIFLTQVILKKLKLDENKKPYLKEPAGDEEIYQILKPKGAFLYHKLFYKDYLWRAFIERPEDFYTVYSRLLRSDFNFSDKILAEVTGKDKTVISKWKKRFFDLMKAMYGYCMTKSIS